MMSRFSDELYLLIITCTRQEVLLRLPILQLSTQTDLSKQHTPTLPLDITKCDVMIFSFQFFTFQFIGVPPSDYVSARLL